MEITSENKVFFTEARPLSRNRVKKKLIVFKIEDVEPPSSHLNMSIPLPENSNYEKVVDSVQNTLKKTNVKFKGPAMVQAWRDHFKSTECKDLLSDLFWYCLVKVNKLTDKKSYKQELLSRISSNYIQVFVNVPGQYKEIFFENFFDSVAQAVFCCMFFSYPKSRFRLNSEEFKSRIYEIVSKQITGLKVKNQGYRQWILELGDGNVLKRQARSQENSFVKENLPIAKTSSQNRRTLQNMRYSPLVANYLKDKKYEAINSVPGWNMRYSVRNMDKERETEKKYSFYRKLAFDTEKKARERSKEFQQIDLKIDEDIKAGNREFRKFVNRINRRTKEIIREGPAEFANRLISLDGLLEEKKKGGYINLY
jgi:hypothetical protein